MNKLSKQEQEILVGLLKRIEPGFLPAEIFHAILRLMVTVTYTVVPFFYDNKLYVHLLQREDNDPYWANLLATPGKVILPTDKSIEDTYSRLCIDEMKNFDMQKKPVFCGYVFDGIPRGKEVAIVNYVLLKSKPAFGELHDIDKLPQNLIPTEIKRIEMAVKKFQNKN